MVVPDSYSDGDMNLLCIVSLFYFIFKKNSLASSVFMPSIQFTGQFLF